MLALQIFEIIKKFQKEEKYSMTDQIRRSSRSVSSNLGGAYRKWKSRGYVYIYRVTRTMKMLKQKYGWNLRWHVDIQVAKHTRDYLENQMM